MRRFYSLLRLGAGPVLAASLAFAQTAIPETPAGRTLKAWLAALNSGDRSRMEQFREAFAPRRTELTDRNWEMYERSGGFELMAIKQSETGQITAELKERKGAITEITLMVTGDPPQLMAIRLGGGPLPSRAPAGFSYSANPLEALDQEARRSEFSGTILVAQNGKILFEHAYGLADRERNLANSLNTKLRIGSMNKMFTAVAILQLVEQGKIKLDDPLIRHLPQYPNAAFANQVTIRHLLTHTGGAGDIFGNDFDTRRAELRDPKDYIRIFGNRAPQYSPGARFEYSNYGFIILGAVVEAVSGVPYFDYVRKNVYDKAGMSDTDSLPESEAVANLAVGYMRGPSGMVSNAPTLPWRGTPAGGGYSTAGDLLRFSDALQSGKLLSKEMTTQATQPQNGGYGFGFGNFGRFWGHNGGAPGMNGELRIYPASGYTVVAIANLDPPGAASALVEFFETRIK